MTVSTMFEAGNVVRTKATDDAQPGAPMTIENVCSFIPGRGIGVLCAWFEGTTLKRDVFAPSRLEHCAPEGA